MSIGVTARPTVLVVTAYTSDFAPIAACSIPRMRAYCDRHGYAFQAHELQHLERRGGWAKVPVIRDALSRDVDFVFWLDVDSLIVRLDVDVLTAARDGAALHIAWHGPDTAAYVSDILAARPHYNTGVMLIRAGTEARDFFSRLWEGGELDHHWTDQAAILRTLGYHQSLGLGRDDEGAPERRLVARLDTAWNSIPGTATAGDPIIQHFAGMRNDLRLTLMRIGSSDWRARDGMGRPEREEQSARLNWLLPYVEQGRPAILPVAELNGSRCHQVKALVSNDLSEQETCRDSIRFSGLKARTFQFAPLLRWVREPAPGEVRYVVSVNSRRVATGKVRPGRPIVIRYRNREPSGVLEFELFARGDGSVPPYLFFGGLLQRYYSPLRRKGRPRRMKAVAATLLALFAPAQSAPIARRKVEP